MNKTIALHVKKGFLLLQFLCSLIYLMHAPAQTPSVTFQPVIETDLNTPVDIVNAGDNTNRLFIISQKDATIRVYDDSHNYLGTLLTVPDVRTSGGEEGLLSIAFHPDYETNRLFFVYYTNTNGDLELARFETGANPHVADPSTKTVIITIPHPGQENHNGGKLNFGSDGYLYFATGDGGGGGDPNNNAQTGTTLLGKMLRINVNPGQTDPYTVPPGNPYIGDPSILPEIWAFGLRNPFRWSFDRANGDMWIGDVGQAAWEEINYRAGPVANTAGVNYQWRCFEGAHSYLGCVVTPGAGIDVAPIFEYPNPGGAAVTGGFVYRGTEYSSLHGTFFAADFYSGTVYLINNVSGSWVTTPLPGFPDWIAAFGEAENGTLYALSLRGTLYKIVGAIVTPVTLVSFTALQKNKIIELAWETRNEVDVKQYEIESSSDGTIFRMAGIVTATKSNTYRFSHIPDQSQKIYYRLRVLDIDGKFEYSKIIQIDPSANDAENFVRPSVINNMVLNIVVQASYDHLQILSIEGKVVWRQNINGRTGSLQYVLPSLVPGSYIVQLISNQKVLTQKILIR